MKLKISLLILLTLALFPFYTMGQNNKVAIAAHRGFWKDNAQNSLQAFDLAQQYNFWGSEFDVQLTQDNTILVYHDNDINGIPIHSKPYSFFSNVKLKNAEPIPTLDQYLQQALKSNYTMMVLEIKEQESIDRTILLADLCIQKLIDHKLYNPSKVMFISFSLETCKHLAKVAPNFSVQFLEELMPNKENLSPQQVKDLGINGIDYEYTIFIKHPNWVKEAHDLGLSVNCWTVNKDKDIKRMIELGVDCITTNEPQRVRDILKTQEYVIKFGR